MTQRLLLDTHVVLWWFTADKRLARATRSAILSAACWISACSIWEIAIKFKLGKLPVAPAEVISAARMAQFSLLPVTPDHAAAIGDLPDLHSDPFDRLLVAQARCENLQLLTLDTTLTAYGANVLAPRQR